jgi:hypothetical protein
MYEYTILLILFGIINCNEKYNNKQVPHYAVTFTVMEMLAQRKKSKRWHDWSINTNSLPLVICGNGNRTIKKHNVSKHIKHLMHKTFIETHTHTHIHTHTHTHTYKMCICWFSANHAALRRENTDWLARNQDIVSEWGDVSIHGLLPRWASTMQIQISVLV